jgi:hypothetical protein
MVKGLARFIEHFRGHSEGFILIGGTACDLVFAELGVEFRRTKDIDIVLQLERMTPEFGRAVWELIKQGEYRKRETESGQCKYYRFDKPRTPDFPSTIELFSRTPDGLLLPDEAVLTPIPVGDGMSSLSAIVLDDEYYAFLQYGMRSFYEGKSMAQFDGGSGWWSNNRFQ